MDHQLQLAIMKKARIILFTLSLTSLLISCSETNKNPEEITAVDPPSFVELPDDFSQISDADLAPLLQMLGDAKLIGFTEGTHGMNEPLNFRNEFIKFLVRKKRIDVIAIESGLIESRFANQYVAGHDIELDYALSEGISCNFETLPQNKDLLQWLRAYNTDSTNEHTVSFYGFDLPKCASNLSLEQSDYALRQAIMYLKQVDPKSWEIYNQELTPLMGYLRLDDSLTDPEIQYWDLDEVKRAVLASRTEDIIALMSNQKDDYINQSSKEDYEWGYRSAICASQNIEFIEGLHNPNLDYSVREKSMFENLQWIMDREKGKQFFLFAHLAHLAKEFYVLNEDAINMMPNNQFGEYLGEHFGDDYTVIGNFYQTLNFYDELVSAQPEAFASMLDTTYDAKNFYLKLDKSDSTYNRPWIVGKRTNAGHDGYMNISKGVDIVFFNKTQHYFENE